MLCRLQQADVHDPWVQQEWGLMLVATGRTQEALAHLEVAGGSWGDSWGTAGGHLVRRLGGMAMPGT